MNMNDRSVKPWSSRQGRVYDYVALGGEKLHTAVRSRNKRISIQGSRHTSLTQPYRHYLYSQQFPFITRKIKNKIKTSENSVTQVHAQESQSAINASHQSKHDAFRDKCVLRIIFFSFSRHAHNTFHDCTKITHSHTQHVCAFSQGESRKTVSTAFSAGDTVVTHAQTRIHSLPRITKYSGYTGTDKK